MFFGTFSCCQKWVGVQSTLGVEREMVYQCPNPIKSLDFVVSWKVGNGYSSIAYPLDFEFWEYKA